MSKRSSHKKKHSRALVLWKRWGDWRKVAIAAATGLFVALLLSFQLLPDRLPVQIGTAAPEDVFAPRYVQYQDFQRTRELKQRIGSQVLPSYSTVLGAEGGAKDAAGSFFTALERAQAAKNQPQEPRIRDLQTKLPNLTATQAAAALALKPEEVSAARKATLHVIEQTMAQPIAQDALDGARAAARNRAMMEDGSAAARQVAAAVSSLSLTNNRIYNKQETEAARRREMETVPPQYDIINRGDLIVRKGEKITADQYNKLRVLGLVHDSLNVGSAVCLALLAFGLVAVFSLYVYQFHPKILQDFRSLLLVAVVVTGSLLLFRMGSSALGYRFTVDQLGFLGMLCSALGAMLLAALLCPQIAVFVGVALSLLTSVMVGADLRFVILSIVSSLVGVQTVTNIRNRADILRAVLILSAVNVATAFVAQRAAQGTFPEDPWITVLWAVIGGVSSVGLFVLFAAWLERPFRITTHLTLLELSDPSHPLLRRLAMEAPGTYAHSIIVGNLSEAAAEAIGADGLFCRVASYYHDVGKVIRPHFFVENQSSENRHNSINPSLSSLVVTSHVKDGVELAEEYRLPPPIIDIIKEHHGTCLIKYFYHRAVTSAEEHTPALEYQFRYDGPRPQTKESGIIMLADSTEAASRTLEKPTPGRIRDLIEHIVRDRLSDGQLDECELTFKDLEKIVSSMTRSLASLLHARIEYPAGDTNELRRMAADGAADKEPVGQRKALADTPETASAAFGAPAAE